MKEFFILSKEIIGSFKEAFPFENLQNKVIQKTDNYDIGGVWALFGKRKGQEKWLCIQVGQTKNIKVEIEKDIKLLNEHLKIEAVKHKIINQLGREIEGFEYYEIPNYRQQLYSYIKKTYDNFVFVCVLESDEIEKRKKAEKDFAIKTQALCWRNGRPYKNALDNLQNNNFDIKKVLEKYFK